MARIYLVRHGKAAASYTDDKDPGLDDLGRDQAETACGRLHQYLPLVLKTSPLKRAQETGAPLARDTQQDISIEARLAEIPSPDLSLQERGPWLQKVMGGKWSEQSQALQEWHGNIAQALRETTTDTVIFSHFVAINAAVGIATNKDEALIFRPDNGSITVIENQAGDLSLVELGAAAVTHVN